MSKLICPSCKTDTLGSELHGEHVVERCSSCYGVWYNEHELNDIISSQTEGHEEHDLKAQLGTFLRQSERHCYKCNVPMGTYRLLEHYNVEIECCPTCDGIWIDHSEMEQVHHSAELQDALSRIYKKFSWKSWAFEMLLRMPVEYNAKASHFPWVTLSLIAVNVLMFLPYFFAPDLRYMMQFYLAALAPFSNGAQFAWSMITSQFMHWDIMHLVGNMYFLWVVGDNIEDVLGKWKFLLIYLLTGMAGMGLQIGIAMAGGQEMILMGASAAIAGLFGMYMIWFRHARLTFMIVVYQIRISAFWFFVIWLVLNNILGLVSGAQGVAYWAHIGGFATGLIIALALRKRILAENPVIRMLQQKDAVIATVKPAKPSEKTEEGHSA